ncbi:Hypothetical Protein FCC1311_055052 [Hondaea fermentalgiana]|uniref:Tetraspanin n=1 Tax=Hondaea fermentalgiana TaxID=2315210 RepID=A0A2R5GKY3_9STRA|nr:Hypothetical Protein FCC1311_055052 [Hondaea fermentalgiana]|eukprot:GBG29283.1 Hypothetical Protein FCC1311_055052 [Hondaea fermentalgiana]
MASCSKGLLVLFNALVLLVGLGVLAIGIFLVVEYNRGRQDIFGDQYPSWANYVAIAVGAVIAIIAAIGFCITLTESKCLLGLTGTIQLFFAIVLIVAGAFIMVYTGYLEDIRDTAVLDLDGGIGNSKQYLYDYVAGVYNTCCSQLTPSIEGCPDVPNTVDEADQYCYFSQDSFAAGASLDADTCSTFQSGGELEWCPTSNAATGEGLKEFQTEAANYMRDYIWPAGVALVVFGGVLFIACILSCHLACRTRPSEGNYQHVPEGKPQQSNQQGMTMA